MYSTSKRAAVSWVEWLCVAAWTIMEERQKTENRAVWTIIIGVEQKIGPVGLFHLETLVPECVTSTV